MKVMRDFIGKYSKEKELVIITGDMNVDGREKMKKPLFENIECQDDYEALINTLTNGNLSSLIDTVRCKYGYQPTTFGVVLSNGEPEETILSHKKENKRDTGIDYIFAMNLRETNFIIDENDTHVEPFHVIGMPFTRISDHYGVQTSIHLKNASN